MGLQEDLGDLVGDGLMILYKYTAFFKKLYHGNFGRRSVLAQPTLLSDPHGGFFLRALFRKASKKPA